MKKIICIVLLLIALIFLCLYAMGLRVRYSVVSQPVGFDEPITLLLGDSADADIQKSIDKIHKPVDEIRYYGQPILNVAIYKDRPSLVKWLLSRGADPNGIDGDVLPLADSITFRKNDTKPEVVDLLLSAGADPNKSIPGLYCTIRQLAEQEGLDWFDPIDPLTRPAEESKTVGPPPETRGGR